MNDVKMIFIEEDYEAKEIELLLNKQLMKRIQNDEYNPHFIYLKEDEPEILEVLKNHEVIIYNFIDIVERYLEGCEMNCETIYNDNICITSNEIIDLLQDDMESYMPNSMQHDVYNADNPFDKLIDELTIIARNQLLSRIENMKFVAQIAVWE